MKKLISLIITVIFICNNFIYALPVDTEKLAKSGGIGGIRGLLKPLAVITGKRNVSIKELALIRIAIAGLLGRDKANNITLVYDKIGKELFIYDSKNIIHISVSRQYKWRNPIEQERIGNINVALYKFTKDKEKSIRDIAGTLVLEAEGEKTSPITDIMVSGANGDKLILSKYTEVPENLLKKNGDKACGWLFVSGVPDLAPYGEDCGVCLEKEVYNALKIRNYIAQKGAGRVLYMEDDSAEFRRANFIAYDGVSGRDMELNEILRLNLDELFKTLSVEEKIGILSGLRKYSPPYGVVFGILDQSKHWLENCRGDGFIGINRWLLEEIKETRYKLADEAEGGNRALEIEKLKKKLFSLNMFLQTFLYHELRHEAFIEERNLLSDMQYDYSGIPKGIEISDMEPGDLISIIKSLSGKTKERFESDLERRQNGIDGRCFGRLSGEKCEDYLNCLVETGVVSVDSLFLHCAAIAGFAPFGNCNGLVIENFKNEGLARKVFRKYENEYAQMYNEDRKSAEEEYRGKISYMLYQLGLNNRIRVFRWRKDSDYDVRLAKEYIVRLIDFISRYVRRSGYEFRQREEQIPHSEAAKLLTASLLVSGEYSKAILMTPLAFKTSGIVVTVSKNKLGFWKLVEEACKERVEKSDERYKGITAKAMKKASIEKELLPRLRILSLFQRYLASLPGKDFSKPFREVLNSFCDKYRSYRKGETVSFSDQDIEDFDKLYKKVCSVLSKEFEIVPEEEEDRENGEREDIIKMLWNTFDFIENLTPNLDCQFTTPFFGPDGLTKNEIEEINKIEAVFDKDGVFIKPEDVMNEDTKKRVQILFRIYEEKILKYRKGLANILARYGTDRDIFGNKTQDLLRLTGGWASAVWLAREYAPLFRNDSIKKAVELDSGLSCFYKTLHDVQGVSQDKITGMVDYISSPDAEYFGINTNRVAGDLCSGGLRDILTGNSIEKQKEKYQLVVSLYQLHKVAGSQKMFNIFKEVNKALQYGGHFAITMPQSQTFGEKALEALREKMGFEPVIKPGVTWNELGDKYRKMIVEQHGDRGLARVEILSKKKFYVIVLKKVGAVKEGVFELQDKHLLMPETIIKKKERYTISQHERVESNYDKEEISQDTSLITLEETGFVTLDIGDIKEVSGLLANDLQEGLKASSALRQKAENVELFQLVQKEIEELWNFEIGDSLRLKNFANVELEKKVKSALEYEGDYSDSDLAVLEGLTIELKKLKKFILFNKDEFITRLEEIKKRDSLSGRLIHNDKQIYDRVITYNLLNLSEITLQEVCDIFAKLAKIEGDIKRDENNEVSRQRLIIEHGSEFEQKKKLIRKYQFIGQKGDTKDIGHVLSSATENLTQELMDLTVVIEKRLLEILSGSERKFKDLSSFEEKLEELFKWMDCEFLFTSSDMEFLAIVRKQWNNEIVSKESIFARSGSYEIMRLRGCLKILSDWKELKELIDWDKGLARLLKGKDEREYAGILDNELLYKPFMQQVDFSLSDPASLIPGKLFGVKLNIPQFEDRGKRIILVRREGEAEKPSVVLLPLEKGEEQERDYNNWFNIKYELLQNIVQEPSNLAICELIRREEIRRLYPDWAKRHLDKGQWIGEYFDKAAIEASVSAYKEEKARRREKAREDKQEEGEEEKIIGKCKKPLVSINYDEIWTKFTVRDLAHILLKIIIDFNNPPAIDVLLEDNLIKNHPKLSEIPRDRLAQKIEELIKYRQYDLQVERSFREYGRLISLVPYIDMPNMCFIDFRALSKKRKIGMDSVIILTGIGSFIWCDYGLGIDESPFGFGNMEDYHNEIVGKILELQYFDADDFLEAYKVYKVDRKIENKMLIMHHLSDPSGLLKKFGVSQKAVNTVSVEEGFKYEENLSMNFANRDKLLAICRRAGRIQKLLHNAYMGKNVDEKYLGDLEYYSRFCFDYFELVSPTIDSVSEILNFMTDGFERLLDGKMTMDEYVEFKKELDRRLNAEEVKRKMAERYPITERDTFYAYRGRDAYYYYLYEEKEKNKRGDKQESCVDTVQYFKSLRLYSLSDFEKSILREYVQKMTYFSDEELDKNTEQIIAYLKASNTINRFVYFRSIYVAESFKRNRLSEMTDVAEYIIEQVINYELKLNIHTKDIEDMNLTVLLTEFYRLKQMLEDTSLGDAAFEVQLTAIRIGREILGQIAKSTDSNTLFYELTAIGNPYHREFVKDIIPGFQSLSIVEFYWELLVLTKLNAPRETIAEQFAQSFNSQILYNPRDKDTALRNIARSIGYCLLIKHFQDRDLKLFIDTFRKYCGEDIAEKLLKLIKYTLKAGKIFCDFDNVSIVTKRVYDILFNEEDKDQKMKILLEKDEGCRFMSLFSLSMMDFKDKDYKKYERCVNFIADAMKTPYEIFFFLKISKGYKVDFSAPPFDRMKKALARRLAEFARSDKEGSLRDMLTGSYPRHLTMQDLVVTAMDDWSFFRRYIAELILSSNPIVFSYAFRYLINYLSDDKDRAVKFHEILAYLIDGILKDEGKLSGIKLKCVIEIIFKAVENISNFTPSAEWQRIIEKYNRGDISFETLMIISQAIYWGKKFILEEVKDKGKRADIKKRLRLEDESGLDIFQKAVLVKRMGTSQEEINPQIREFKIMELTVDVSA